MAHDWWLVPSVFIGLSAIFSEASLRKAETKDGKLVFRPSLLLRMLYLCIGIALSVLLYRQWIATAWWVDGCAVVILLWIFLGWPKTILTDKTGVECRWIWGRRARIPWDEVEYAEKGSAGRIEVVGVHRRIRFEGYNADATQFRKTLLKEGKLKHVEGPEKFTGLHL